MLPCSRVAHIERTKKPYNSDIDYYAKRNALRAAEVWMDGFKSHVYMAWNIPMTVSQPGQGRGGAAEARARPLWTVPWEQPGGLTKRIACPQEAGGLPSFSQRGR